MSYKIFGEDLRSQISKRKRRIGTSEGMSVLPIWLLCEFIKIIGSTEGG
jgi:hypothetical protein